MRDTLSAALLAALLTAGCSAGDATAPGAASLREVPMHDNYEATGGIAPGPSADCPLVTTLSGGGEGTHVGKYTITNSHCDNPTTGEFFNGSFTKTTANGDQLFGTYSGTFTATGSSGSVVTFAINGDLIFTGGTGKFAGATGQQTLTGTQTTDFGQAGFPTSITLTLDGVISSVGSNP
ncbi:MAG TPA: hypothetical protein VFW66_09870 [Gemmatimonadales bacterium]|nr:hypothetical protein [Gemmatimonadales bacterium]